ncbi:MAG: hypothetical protein KGI37_03040 [Alphaproteobacteria bacterium]|nr:hypothetical protein [Alphaproteobacteria bacterium]
MMMAETASEVSTSDDLRLPHRPTDADIIPAVQAWINEKGVEDAFKIIGKLLLYSGPRRSVSNAFMGLERNHPRASWMDDAQYTIIDRTYIGRRLDNFVAKKNIYTYLEGIYANEKDENGRLLYERYATAVMMFASVVLVSVAKGDVETRVCGADERGIFYTKELPALMANKKISSINGVSIERLRAIYYSEAKDATYQTFRKICQGEAALARSRRNSAATKKNAEDLQEEYEVSRAFFIAERKETIKAIQTPSPKISDEAMPLPPAHNISHPFMYIHGMPSH